MASKYAYEYPEVDLSVPFRTGIGSVILSMGNGYIVDQPNVSEMNKILKEEFVAPRYLSISILTSPFDHY